MSGLEKHFSLLFVYSVLVSGCVKGHFVVDIDPVFENDTAFYKIQRSNNMWTDKRYNMSFGFYKTSNMDVGGKSITSSNKRATTKQKLSYTFQVDENKPWEVSCNYTKLDNPRRNKNFKDPTVSGNWECSYHRFGDDQWILTVGAEVNFTNNKDKYTATLVWIDKILFEDGRRFPLPPVHHAGYDWIGNNKKIAAVITYRKYRQFILRRDTPTEVSDMLAMASTGLMLYHTVILEESP